MGRKGGRPPDEAISKKVEKLHRVFEDADALVCLVARFYEDDATFAGSTFLRLKSEENWIQEADLLAVTLMGEVFPPGAVRALLEGPQCDEAHRLLKDIPVEDKLWERNVDALHTEPDPVLCLWRLLIKLNGVGPTKVSKLMARKRPHLVPIYDSVIGERIATVDDYWYVFHAFMKDDVDHNNLVEGLKKNAGLDDVPLLRVLDSAVWMFYSNGEAAQAARGNCGLPEDL